jgi:taurine dioxygenase
MKIEITPSGQACGAAISGIDLSNRLSAEQTGQIHSALLKHHVLSFPGQNMSDDDLERFSLSFGDFGQDPFFDPIEGREHIAAISREANEKSPLFAENWHSDWSFQEYPPTATCLLGIKIPPIGGDTLFANQHAALEVMPPEMREKLEGKMAIHSAKLAYAPEGTYGEGDVGRSMAIRPDVSAKETFLHPLIRKHPETSREGLFSCLGYIIGIDGMAQEEALPLLTELYAWQSRDEFIYRHVWQAGMLIMWDNRSVLHRATGGYEGYERLLHRTTIGSSPN